MAATRFPSSLEAEQIGQVTVISFQRREILDEKLVRHIGNQLMSLVKLHPKRDFVLNLAAVQRLSSTLVGYLATFQHQVQSRGGRLALCRIDPRFHEAFRLLEFSPLPPIYAEEQEALQAFQE